MDCSICCETFNRSNRKPISCVKCAFETCRSCFQKYIMENESIEPECMNPTCKRPFCEDFIQDNTPNKFFTTDFKSKKQKKLFDIETSFLPATQFELERDIRKGEIMNAIRAKEKEIAKMKKEIEKLRDQLYDEDTISAKDTSDTSTYVRACPSEECKGFLSSKWNCTLCNTNVCKECHRIKPDGVEHVCDQNDIDSVKLIAKDSKKCPTCKTLIFKIDGCDQMFCTSCHTAFSWKTLKIETGRLHNPHYYQWLRENTNGDIPREPGDGPNACPQNADLIHERVFRSMMEHGYNPVFWNIFIIINHIRHVTLVAYPEYRVTDIQKNMDIRKKYMKNEITSEKFKTLLFNREKNARKRNEYNQVLNLFVQLVTEKINDTYSRHLRENRKIKINDITKIITYVKSVSDYFNAETEKIAKRYCCKQMKLSENFMFVV